MSTGSKVLTVAVVFLGLALVVTMAAEGRYQRAMRQYKNEHRLLQEALIQRDAAFEQRDALRADRAQQVVRLTQELNEARTTAATLEARNEVLRGELEAVSARLDRLKAAPPGAEEATEPPPGS